MTQKSFQPFPTDILKEIFEHAALFQDSSCYALALVSQSVQKWTDPLVFRTILVTEQRIEGPEPFLEMLDSPEKSPRFIRALSFVRTLAATIPEFELTWETIVKNFPGLVVFHSLGDQEVHKPSDDFHEGIDDLADFQPPVLPTLRRLGGGYGCRTIYGSWMCVQMITHLDLTCLYCNDWPELESRGLPLLSCLTHLSFTLDEGSEDMDDDLRLLPPLFPQSLQLCLLDVECFSSITSEDAENLLRHAYALDHRLLLASKDNCQVHHQWVLKVEEPLVYAFKDWSGEHSVDDTYWVRGLEMVKRREEVRNNLL
ncbi:hypothetical protein DL96DRAFT_628584 [Flagelloscypha sp. PMI_526]|nr:hypothetical protein DL96DRAFT_628584 [Flagelloscypha sp. PMI_526]